MAARGEHLEAKLNTALESSYATQAFEPAAAATRDEAAAAMVRMTTCLTGDEVR